MSYPFEIAGHGARLSIEVFNYENSSAQNISDANWLKCRVVLNIYPFSGNFDASFTTQDFVRFLDDLRKILSELSGTASFLTDEDTLRLTVKMEKTGGVQISGIAEVSDQTHVTLSFSFKSDQTFVSQTYRELEAIVLQFPVKG
ncbi:MAG: hypothetical protein M1536_03860 [Firmicutes bacterium]|nr:hypothetical protein [Bacillota bacterium]